MKTELIDANILIRLLTWDDPVKGAAVRALLVSAAAGARTLRMTTLAFAEIVWVLEKVYGWAKADIASHLVPLLNLSGLNIDESVLLQRALALYHTLNIDFIDAYQGELAVVEGSPVIYSYDRDLDRVPGITRIEP